MLARQAAGNAVAVSQTTRAAGAGNPSASNARKDQLTGRNAARSMPALMSSEQQHDLAPGVALLKQLERGTHLSQRESRGDRQFQFTGGNHAGEFRKHRSI